MSQENVEIVRRVVEAFNRRDLEAASELWHPEVEFYEEPEIPDGRVWRGSDGARAYWQESFERWEDMRIEPSEFVDLPDAVIVIGAQWGRGGHSGVEVSAGYAGLFEVRDDKVVRVRTYAKRDEALEAAGLRE
jgi:ketosteroid isomerase-like protein